MFLYLDKCKIEDIDKIVDLQSQILEKLQSKGVYIFQPNSRKEIEKSLKNGDSVGFFDENREILAYCSIIKNPMLEENLVLDLIDQVEIDSNVLVFDTVFVSEKARGKGFQIRFIESAIKIAKAKKKSGIIATVHPDNKTSKNNFLKMNFKVLSTRKKYDSVRNYMYLSLKGA